MMEHLQMPPDSAGTYLVYRISVHSVLPCQFCRTCSNREFCTDSQYISSTQSSCVDGLAFYFGIWPGSFESVGHDMCPSPAGNDVNYACLANAMFDGEIVNSVARCECVSDVLYYDIRQFCSVVPFSSVVCPVQQHVRHVTSMRVVPQVVQPVVSRIPIIVTDLHPFWAWADERFHDQSMDETELVYCVFGEVQASPSVCIRCLQYLSFVSADVSIRGVCYPVHGSHPSRIGDHVEILEPMNRQPFLHKHHSSSERHNMFHVSGV